MRAREKEEKKLNFKIKKKEKKIAIKARNFQSIDFSERLQRFKN